MTEIQKRIRPPCSIGQVLPGRLLRFLLSLVSILLVTRDTRSPSRLPGCKTLRERRDTRVSGTPLRSLVKKEGVSNLELRSDSKTAVNPSVYRVTHDRRGDVSVKDRGYSGVFIPKHSGSRRPRVRDLGTPTVGGGIISCPVEVSGRGV